MENINLPAEVAQIAQNVSVEKRNEVQSVLNHVFNGVSKMREQLESITVVDINDKVSMNLAKTVRLGVRQERLDAEKTFDSKRSEVQAQMLSYKTEDQLWLKAKQTMQILTKEIEENARWKEETKDRYETEQKELKIQQRMVKVSKVAPEMLRSEFENMSDETFELFLSGIEKAYNDRIEAEQKAEKERIAKEKAEAAERERIRLENEKLRKEAEAAKIKLEEERKAVAKKEAEAARIAAEERKKIEEKAQKEAEAAKIKLQKEAAERAKLEKELADKKAEEAAKFAAKVAAAKAAAAAPDKEKLMQLIKQINEIQLPTLSTPDAVNICNDVKALLAKITNYITEKTTKL